MTIDCDANISTGNGKIPEHRVGSWIVLRAVRICPSLHKDADVLGIAKRHVDFNIGQASGLGDSPVDRFDIGVGVYASSVDP